MLSSAGDSMLFEEQSQFCFCTHVEGVDGVEGRDRKENYNRQKLNIAHGESSERSLQSFKIPKYCRNFSFPAAKPGFVRSKINANEGQSLQCLESRKSQ